MSLGLPAHAATPAQQAYLKASNTDAGDFFGGSVAISGDTMVVGASTESSNATGVNGNQNTNGAPYAGAAYVFVRNGATWTQQAYLKASNAQAGDLFGESVGVSGDTIVVGAFSEDGTAANSGAGYVFVRSGTNWIQQAYLKASNAGTDDAFGGSVAVSGDTILIGASGEDSNATGVGGDQTDNSSPGSGAAYVFVRSGTNWTQQAYLKALNAGAGDSFGYPVAVSGDTAVIGASGEASNATGVNGDGNNDNAPESGAAYVFVRNGTAWNQQAYLKASNAEGRGQGDIIGDQFGTRVAISGETVVVGALREDSNATGVNGNQNTNGAPTSGAAYVFVRSGATWIQQAYLKASNTEGNDAFGYAVAVSGDTVVVGAVQEDSIATGINGNQSDNSGGSCGAAYVFVRSGTTWSHLAYVKASNTDQDDKFGWSVAVSQGTVVVGAVFEDSNATGVNGNQSDNSAVNAGAAYVFAGFPGSGTEPVRPTITQQPQSQTITQGGTATLTVVATGSTPLAYQWFAGQQNDVSDPIPGATNSSFTTPALMATALFWVEVSNARGSANSETATVTVPATRDPLRLTWSQPASIVFGTALGPQQLNATANVPGSFIYAPGAGTVLPVGSHTLSALFTPVDTTNYTSASASVSLAVTPAPLMVRANDVTNVVCAPLPVFQARYAGLIGNDTPASLGLPLRLSTSASNCSPPGEYVIECSGPAVWKNYAVSYLAGTLRQVADTTTTLSLEPNNPVTQVGEVRLFRLTGIGAGGERTDLTKAAAWQSLNPEVLEVCAGGFVVGVQPGNAVLRAEYEGQSASVALTVQAVAGRQVFVNRTLAIQQTQLGRCQCLSAFRSTNQVTGLAGVVKNASAILLGVTGPASAYLDHFTETVFTSVTLLERDPRTDDSIHQWGIVSPPVCLALRDEATQSLDRYSGPVAGIYQPDTTLGRDNMLTAARGPSPNGSWVLNGYLRAPYQIPGGWMLVLDTGANEPPTISSIADVSAAVDTRPVVIPLPVNDAETPVSRLVPSVMFSNPGLSSGYSYWGGRLASGQPVFYFRPDRFPSGQTRATVTVTDEVGAQAETSFNITVTPNRSVASFANSTSIQIPSYGKALLYPSPILVANMPGRVQKVEVTLRGLSHSWPDDLDILLVAPNGRKVMLMSDAGGGAGTGIFWISVARPQQAVPLIDPQAPLVLKFSSSATVVPPDGGEASFICFRAGVYCVPWPDCSCIRQPLPRVLTSGTFLPVNYGSGDEFPSPVPAGPYSTSLDSLVGGQPNGTWSLYVFDDTRQDQGVIAAGWSLDLVSSTDVAPAPAPPAGQGTPGLFSPAAAGPAPEPEPPPDHFLIKAWQTGDPLIRLESVEELPTGEALLRLIGRAGTLYTIERSTNGASWEFMAQDLVGSEQFDYLAKDHALSGRPTYRVSEGSRAPMAESPRILEFTRLPDGTSRLLLEATSGRAVVLQTSADLQDWQELQIFINPGGVVELTDSPFDEEGTRFYRLLVP